MSAEPAGYSWLPQVLAEIAEVAGLDVALKLAEARGGIEVYIPAIAPDDHWLVETVGRDAADAICNYFRFASGDISKRGNDKLHGASIEIPLGPFGAVAKVRARVDRMIAEGRSQTEIARAAGYTQRGVRKRAAKSAKRKDPRQARLL